MKTKLFLGISVLVLWGCAHSMDRELTTQKTNTPITDTVEAYQVYRTKGWATLKPPSFAFNTAVCLLFFNVFCPLLPIFDSEFANPDDYSDLMIPEVKYECLVEKERSDKCILYEREHPRPETKVKWFNYKKYLPAEYTVYSDDDFLKLVEYSDKIECSYDDNCTNLTTTECESKKRKYVINCATEKENKLQSYINGGMARERKTAEAARLASEKAAAEAAEKRAQAKKEYASCLKKANVCDTSYTRGCRVEHLPLLTRVINVAPDGVLVRQGNAVYSRYYFVYTKEKYSSGDMIPCNFYHEYVGKYEYNSISGRQRIDAFKETNIKICTYPGE